MADALIRKLNHADETRDEHSVSECAGPFEPERLGRFEIEGRLGAGAMGVVYAAHDPMLRRDVAIKVLARHRASDEALARARREAQGMAQLSHPNVVEVFAIGEHEGSLYIAMERIRGQTLRAWQASNPPWSAVLSAYRQAGLGLAELHAAGLVHRDFKPANAMIDTQERVRVLDLGLVREIDDSSASDERSGGSRSLRFSGSGSTTASDAVLGTPAYMAPEQFMGGHVGPPADQFSFCVALYEALYGHRPFKAKTFAQLVEAIATGRIEPPPSDTRVPRRVLRALRRGLSEDPRRRFGSMEVLLDRLAGRRGRAAGIGGVVGLGLLASMAWLGLGPAQECSLRTRFERAWTPSRQDAFSDAPRLVERANALSQRVEEVCASSDSRQMSCTRGLVERFDTVVELLADPTEGLEVDALVESLPEPETCDDETAVLGDPAEVAAVTRRLQRVDAMALAGELDQALAAADEAVKAAHRLGAPTLSMEAFFQRAKVHARRHELERANADFTAAYELAVVTRDQVAIVTQSLSQVWVNRARGDLDAAEHWLRVASAALETAEGEHPKLLARLLQRRGQVLQARGEMDEARTLLVRSERAWADLDEPREQATLLSELVWADLETGHMDAAVEHARRGIEVLTAAFTDAEPQLGTQYLNLGNAHQRRGEHQASLDAYGQAVDRRSRTFGEDHPTTALAQYSKATALLELERYEDARELLLRARENLPPGHPAVEACELSLSRIASVSGDHEEAVMRANRALIGFEEKLGVDHPSTAEARAELARVELSAGDVERALSDARKARSVFEATFGPTHDYVGTCLEYEARALLALDRPDEAEASFERALQIAIAAQGEGAEKVEGLREELEALRSP